MGCYRIEQYLGIIPELKYKGNTRAQVIWKDFLLYAIGISKIWRLKHDLKNWKRRRHSMCHIRNKGIIVLHRTRIKIYLRRQLILKILVLRIQESHASYNKAHDSEKLMDDE